MSVQLKILYNLNSIIASTIGVINWSHLLSHFTDTAYESINNDDDCLVDYFKLPAVSTALVITGEYLVGLKYLIK